MKKTMITHATDLDIAIILNTVNACVENLYKKNIFQWNKHYPNKSVFFDDIKNRNLYIIKNENHCQGLIVLNDNQSEEWKHIQWPEATKKPLIIHRLIVHPDFQEKGIGKQLISFALKHAMSNQYDAVRFDAYSGNTRLIQTYENYGCKKYGEAVFPYRELPFICFEVDIRNNNFYTHDDMKNKNVLVNI